MFQSVVGVRLPDSRLARQATDVFHLAFRRICQKLGEYPTGTIVAVTLLNPLPVLRQI